MDWVSETKNIKECWHVDFTNEVHTFATKFKPKFLSDFEFNLGGELCFKIFSVIL